jgi:hypothetical protein
MIQSGGTNLFKTESFGLWDAKPYVDKAEREHSKEDQKNERSDTIMTGSVCSGYHQVV